MNILFLGDIIGKPGRDALHAEHLPRLRPGAQARSGHRQWRECRRRLRHTTRAIAEEFFGIGVDVISTGNHWADQKEIITYIDTEDRILRPANYPKGTPGRGANLYPTPAGSVLVVNAMGRVFMDALDDPFAAVDRELSACVLGEGADAVVVDMHAEGDDPRKWQQMGHFCDGRASLVVGTHQHVPTADAQILLVRRCLSDRCRAESADYDSVIGGMDRAEAPLQRFTRKISVPTIFPRHWSRHLVRRLRANGSEGAWRPHRAGASGWTAETGLARNFTAA